jgi:peptide subunit release factor 1 (eRF1)
MPVSNPLVDGSTVINQDGDVFVYRETDGMPTTRLCVAEPFIVKEEYNQRVIVCPVNDEAMKWLSNKQEIPPRCIVGQPDQSFKIMCPTCGTTH